MRWIPFFAVGSVLAVAGAAGGCVGDDPATPPTTSPEASTPCTGADCVDAGGTDGAATTDSGGTTDAGTDSGPPACSKIMVTTLAGSVEGSTNGPGNVATFKGPEGITVDTKTGTLFVADTGNSLVRKVLPDGTTSTYSTTTNAGAWLQPRHAAYPPDYDTLFVSDRNHDQVFNVPPTGPATADFGLGSMRAFAVQPTTFKKFVVSATRVAEYMGGSAFEAATFSGTFDVGFVDGKAVDARYGNLVDLAFDNPDELYVADQLNHRIRQVVVTGTNRGDVKTIAGNATAGRVDGKGTAAQFEGPNAFALDVAKHVFYVADGATIRVVTTGGDVTTLVGSTSAYADGDGCTAKFVNAKGITRFANELFVLDVNRIRKIVLPPP